MTIPSYATGTASIASGGTTVTIAGGILTGNARELDFIVINGVLAGPILGITDATHLTVPKWGGATQTNVAYAIYQVAQRSSADTSVTDDLRKQVAALNFQGFPVLVPATSTVPDPSLGDEGQFAVQFLPALAWWQKTGGLWVASGGPIRGYGGTSTTSLSLSAASKSFTTQTNLAYQIGSRVRLSNDSTHYMEGPVTAYDVTTGAMTVNVGRVTGSGTFSEWNLSVAGDYAGGDLLASNNLADVASTATARTNLAVLGIANNLADVASIPSARGILGADGMVTVRCIATANVTIASALINGASIDGVTVATNDRVLLAGQTAPAENGVYIVAASGAASRSAAFNTYDSMCGYFFSIREGTVYADTLWQCTSDRGGTLGTTALTFRNPRPSIYAAPFDALAYNGMQVNGSCEVSQENGGNSVSIPAGYQQKYIIDGMEFTKNLTTGAFTAQQVASVFPGYDKELKLTCTTAQASLGAEIGYIRHYIEGYRFSRAMWGTASAVPITVGAWIKSSATGNIQFQLANNAFDTAAVASVSVVAGVAKFVTVTLAAQTTGAWLTTNGIGGQLLIYLAQSGALNLAATVGATVEITGLIVLPGVELPSSDRAPFIMRPYDQEILAAKRYWRKMGLGAVGRWYSATVCELFQRFDGEMRAAPSLALLNSTPAIIEVAVAARTGSGSTLSGSIVSTPIGWASQINGFSGATANNYAVCRDADIISCNARL